jgi:hypothetical protein
MWREGQRNGVESGFTAPADRPRASADAIRHDEADTHQPVDELQARVEQLERALASRIVIEQAKGVLRERFGWPVQEAFEILRYAARSSRTNIHALATDVVNDVETPSAITIALARSSRWRAAHMREHAEAQRERARALETRVVAQQQSLAWHAEGARRRRSR